MKKTFAFALAFFTVCTAFAAPVNLLQNPDFTAPDGQGGKVHGEWAGINPARFKPHFYHKIDKSESVKGGQSLKLETDGPVISVDQQLANLKPNTKYRFSFSVKLQDVKPVHPSGGFFCQFYTGVKKGFPNRLLTGTAPWKKYTFEFTTPAKLTPKPYLELRSWEGKGIAWFDDIELVEVEK